MADWSIISPLIGAILSGGILVSITGFLYNDFLNQPNIIITVPEPENDRNRGVIQVANRGWDPAHNLVLRIMAPKPITNNSVETSENLTMTQTGPKILMGYSPRYVHGDGSVSKIFLELNSTLLEKKSTETDYGVYATFDEGSSTMLYPPPSRELYGQIGSYLYNAVPEWYKFYFAGGFSNLILWSVVYVIFLILLVFSVDRLILRRKYSFFIRNTRKQIRIVCFNLGDKQNMKKFTTLHPSILGRKVDVDDTKYSDSTLESYKPKSRRNLILFWTYSHIPIWDLWYTKSDDFKSHLLSPDMIFKINKFYDSLRDRELLVEFKDLLIALKGLKKQENENPSFPSRGLKWANFQKTLLTYTLPLPLTSNKKKRWLWLLLKSIQDEQTGTLPKEKGRDSLTDRTVQMVKRVYSEDKIKASIVEKNNELASICKEISEYMDKLPNRAQTQLDKWVFQ